MKKATRKTAPVRKAKAHKAKARKPGGTGPSGRTPAQRDAIDERARKHSIEAKRKARAKLKEIRDTDKPAQRAGLFLRQPTRPVKDIKIGQRYRVDMGDIVGLAKSIDARGELLEPIVITPQNQLIDGQRRLVAWPLAKLSDGGRKPIPVHVVDIDSIVAGEWDANHQRKDFSPSEAVAIKRALEPKLKAAAKERQAAGQRKGAASTNAGAGKAAAPSKPQRAVDAVAQMTGKSRRSLDKAEEIVNAAEADPARFGKLKEDMDKTGRVDGPHKRLRNLKAGEAIRTSPPPLPGKGPYRGVMLDPPWAAEPDADPGLRRARGYYPYPTLSIGEVVTFCQGARSILHDDCVIGLWITNYHLVKGHHVAVLEALDAQGVTIVTWCKPRLGRGQVRRGTTEHLIIATRGKPTIDFAHLPTHFEAPLGKHSEKPQLAFDDFVKMVAAERYASLFETVDRGPQWDCHGDQVGKLVVAPVHVSDDTTPAGVLAALEAVVAGTVVQAGAKLGKLLAGLVSGKKTQKLTKMGERRHAELRSVVSKPDAPAPEQQALPGLAGPKFNYRVRGAGDKIGGKLIDVLKRAHERGALAALANNLDVTVEWTAGGAFICGPGHDQLTEGARGAISIVRAGTEAAPAIEIDAYAGPEGKWLERGGMPFPKLATFLRAWRAADKPKDDTPADDEAPAFDPDQAAMPLDPPAPHAAAAPATEGADA